MPKPELGTLARAFRDDLVSLLNRTVTDGLTLSVVIAPPESMVLGFGVSKHSFVPEEAFPLRKARNGQQFHLGVFFKLALDDDGQYLMVMSSSFGVYESREMSEGSMFRYEYERNKMDGYPEAHLHVRGDWSIGGNTSSKLHLPLGDRRFRPCLEDLVEFLIVEGATQPRTDDWKTELRASRERFFDNQLRAAIRQRPATARSYLDELDRESQ
jgi:hypothetical protein